MKINNFKKIKINTILIIMIKFNMRFMSFMLIRRFIIKLETQVGHVW